MGMNEELLSKANKNDQHDKTQEVLSLLCTEMCISGNKEQI